MEHFAQELGGATAARAVHSTHCARTSLLPFLSTPARKKMSAGEKLTLSKPNASNPHPLKAIFRAPRGLHAAIHILFPPLTPAFHCRAKLFLHHGTRPPARAKTGARSPLSLRSPPPSAMISSYRVPIAWPARERDSLPAVAPPPQFSQSHNAPGVWPARFARALSLWLAPPFSVVSSEGKENKSRRAAPRTGRS